MIGSSPLGKYSEPAAMVTALAVVAAWLFTQVGILGAPADSGALDAAATFAMGVLLGQRSTTNGAAKIAAAAHARLDQLGAPAADQGR